MVSTFAAVINVLTTESLVTAHIDTLLFAGSASVALATRVAQLLEQPLGRSFVEHFPDGEVNVRLDEPVRGRDVFLIQATAPPVNDNLIELLAYADACRRSSARSLVAVIPYFGYARSDKRRARREPIMASMVAQLLEATGISRILTVDLHAPQAEGFFHIPVDSLSALPNLAAALKRWLPPRFVVVSPDEGRVRSATELGRWLRARIAVLHKHRESGSASHVVRVVGDVQGQPCVVIDDIISTGSTIRQSVEALLAAGAEPQIYVAATHGVFAPDALRRLEHPAIEKILVTDTIAHDDASLGPVEVVSVCRLLAAAIRRLRDNESLADLYVRPTDLAGEPSKAPDGEPCGC